jgi:RHS repeat-associated protein
MADANPYRFSSKAVHPASGLYDYGFRWYSPNMQRWTSQDPIGEMGGINLYGFVENSPVNLIDDWGLQAVRPGPARSGPMGEITSEILEDLAAGRAGLPSRQLNRSLTFEERFYETARREARDRELVSRFPGHQPGMSYLEQGELRSKPQEQNSTPASNGGSSVNSVPNVPISGTVQCPENTPVYKTEFGPPHQPPNVKHNNAIEDTLQWAKDQGATSLRKNKPQVDNLEHQVSTRKPDASYFLGEYRYNVNYVSNWKLDKTKELNREIHAFNEILKADQKAVTSLIFSY